jgi:signal transduction histidine kinase
MKPLVTQVFSNIIENAIKYSVKNSRVDIQGSYDKGTDEVVVSIHNRGIPLREEDTLRIFERGYRTQEARDQYPAGTGFGLYIAKKIIELHRGSLTARSHSAGSVFTVRLPVRALAGKARHLGPKDRFARACSHY